MPIMYIARLSKLKIAYLATCYLLLFSDDYFISRLR